MAMNLFQKLTRLFTAPTLQTDDRFITITVQCDRCGEIVQSRINLSNDLSAEYDERGQTTTYICRKVQVGQQHCFQPIEVRLTFDANRHLMERQITGGKFVEGSS